MYVLQGTIEFKRALSSVMNMCVCGGGGSGGGGGGIGHSPGCAAHVHITGIVHG